MTADRDDPTPPHSAHESGDTALITAPPGAGSHARLQDEGIAIADVPPRLRAVIESLDGKIVDLERRLARAADRIAELEQLADVDPLLPVLNRRAFTRELSRTMSTAQRYDSQAGFLFLDVDNLKRINDTFGHEAGDAALRHIACAVLASVRASDTVGRLGGDELGIILKRTDLASAERKATHLMREIGENPLDWNGTSIALSASCGACAIATEEEVSQVIMRADQAMYLRKQARASTPAEPVTQ